MLLPYASYLRIYERAAGASAVGTGVGSADSVASVTLAREQATVLRKTVAGSAPAGAEDLVGHYELRRGGDLYLCAVDLALRSWLALATFVESIDRGTQGLLRLTESAERAEVQLGSWRELHPTMAPHIRSATWGVPRTWFLLVTEDEREEYDVGGVRSVRFRAALPVARRRLAAAQGVLAALIGDEELADELEDLDDWLGSFDEDCWVELDYAGVAQLLGESLAADRSAGEIANAVAALARRDFGAAGESYRAFTERWRVANALERAN